MSKKSIAALLIGLGFIGVFAGGMVLSNNLKDTNYSNIITEKDNEIVSISSTMKNLYKDIIEKDEQISLLKIAKNDLQTKYDELLIISNSDMEELERLKLNIQTLQTEIDNAQNELNSMQEKYSELELKYNKLMSLHNSQIEYNGCYTYVYLPLYEATETGDLAFKKVVDFQVNDPLGFALKGSDIVNSIENYYKNIEVYYNQALNIRDSRLKYVTCDKYKITIDNSSTTLDTNYNEIRFNSNASLLVNVIYNGGQSDFDTVIQSINQDSWYNMLVKFDFNLNSYNEIVNSKVNFIFVSL